MKTIKQLKEEYDAQLRVLESLADVVKSENRDFTTEEDTQRDAAMDKIDALKKEIARAEREDAIRKDNANLSGVPVVTESKEEKDAKRDFNWVKATQAAVDRSLLNGLEKEMHEEGVKEMRGIGKPADTRSIVIPSRMLESRAVITENSTTGIQKMGFIDHLYAATVLDEAGATFNTGITDMRFPLLGAVSVEWEGETDNAADGGSAMSKVDLSPKRLASYLDYSKLANLQHGGTLQSALIAAIGKAVGSYLELSVFTDKTAAGAPTDIKDVKTAATASNIAVLAAKLIEQVASANGLVNSAAYIWSTDLISEVMTAAGVTGVNPLYVNGMVNGYKTLWSSQLEVVTASTPVVYFGDWSQLQIAQFGGLEIMVDPYTQAVGGKNRLVLNSYWDFAETKTAKIAIGEIAQTT